MKLIDVGVLKEWVENWFTKNRFYHPYAKNNNIPIPELYDIIEQMPFAQPDWTELMVICDNCGHAIHVKKADAKPIVKPERKKGRWIRHQEQKNIYGGKCVECSECGERYMVQFIEDEKFCRNCGAYMGGEQDGKD